MSVSYVTKQWGKLFHVNTTKMTLYLWYWGLQGISSLWKMFWTCSMFWSPLHKSISVWMLDEKWYDFHIFSEATESNRWVFFKTSFLSFLSWHFCIMNPSKSTASSGFDMMACHIHPHPSCVDKGEGGGVVVRWLFASNFVTFVYGP